MTKPIPLTRLKARRRADALVTPLRPVPSTPSPSPSPGAGYPPRVVEAVRPAATAGAAWLPPPDVVRAGAVGAVATLALLAVGVRTAPLLLACFGVGLVWWWRRRLSLLAAARQAQLPEALERMAGALRTGSSLPQALVETARSVEAPLGRELAEMAQATSRGRPLAEVVDAWSAAHADHGTRLVASAIVLATAVGATPARALDGVATTLRERLELAGERRSLATQARASAVVLTAAPLGFAALLTASDPASARFLLGTTAGWMCLVVGVGLDVVGGLWMARLTKAVVR